MTRILKSKTIDAIKPDPERRIEIPDGLVSGLYLVVQPSGKKSWALRYRYRGQPVKLTLGRHPAISLADARTKAKAGLEKLDLGTDPRVGMRAAKAATVTLPGTVGTLCDRRV